LVVVFCGLPGSGKTTLSCLLKQYAQQRCVNVVHIEFDELLDEKLLLNNDFTLALSETRQAALTQISNILSDQQQQHQEQQTYLLIDDNMYYKSMRRAVYNLSANHSASYAQISVQTPLSICLERDKGRDEGRRVGEEVIRRMDGKIEWPGDENWERNSYIFQGREEGEERACSINKLLDALERDAKNPLVYRAELEKEREKSRDANAKSVIHECDMKLRKITQELFKQTPSLIKQNKEKMKKFKDFVINTKQTAMNALKQWLKGKGEGEDDFCADFQKLRHIETSPEAIELLGCVMNQLCCSFVEDLLST